MLTYNYPSQQGTSLPSSIPNGDNTLILNLSVLNSCCNRGGKTTKDNKQLYNDESTKNEGSSEPKPDDTSIKILNPCIEKFIPLKIEKGDILSHPDDANKQEIRDISIDDNASFYKATIKLRDQEIGEFHTRYVVHRGSELNEHHTKHITNFFNPLKSFEQNTFSQWENSINWNKNDHFCKLLKDEGDYIFKYCDKNGNIGNDDKFAFPSQLIDFNQEYIKDLSDLKPDSMYVIAKSKLYERFNNKEDYLHIHPAEIHEYSEKESTFIPGKLIGTINHEYGLFRNSAGGDKSEFIFSDVITKGKDVRITDKDCITNPENGCKIKPEGFLFLAKIKSDSSCIDSPRNSYSELKLEEYALGFASNRGCTKIISNTHLYKDTNLKDLFDKNAEEAITAPERVPSMHDLYDLVQCTTDPVSSGSMFI